MGKADITERRTSLFIIACSERIVLTFRPSGINHYSLLTKHFQPKRQPCRLHYMRSMKKTFLVTCLVIISGTSFAQINILDIIGKRNFDRVWLQETDNNIYLMRYIYQQVRTTVRNKTQLEI